jgi:hypothetical protein
MGGTPEVSIAFKSHQDDIMLTKFCVTVTVMGLDEWTGIGSDSTASAHKIELFCLATTGWMLRSIFIFQHAIALKLS